jgi:hypothetical protein
MTRRISNRLNNGVDRDGFTLGVSLDWSHVFLGICGLGFAGVVFFVGLAVGLSWDVGVLCDS